MYQKIARIGPISFGIFFALVNLLLLVVVTLFGIYVLPKIPMGADALPITIFESIPPLVMSMLDTQDGMIQMAIYFGFAMLGLVIIGLVLAILYNIAAAITGGIKIRVTDLGYED